MTREKPKYEGPGEGKIPVTKIEAATRQIEMAIELWFQGKDLVSICTLGHAGHEILRRMALSRDVPIKSIFELESIPEDVMKDFVDTVKFSPNFFKHGGKENEVHYFPERSVHMIMVDAVRIYHALGFPPRRIFYAFSVWVQLTQPSIAFRSLESIYAGTVKPEVFDQLRKLEKHEFFKLMLKTPSAKFAGR